MACHNKGPKHNRDSTHRKEGTWNIHVARSLAEDQPELESYLGYIREHTGHFVRYKPLADLCLNVVLMDGVLHKIFGTRKFDKIPRQRIRDFERELNSNLTGNPDRVLPIADIREPFGVYGDQKQFLGIRLSRKYDQYDKTGAMDQNPRISDSAAIVNYLAKEYELPKTFAKKNLKPLDAHINIGTLCVENLSPEEQDYVTKFPSDYILRSIRKDNEFDESTYGKEIEPIKFAPQFVTLNGLRAVSEERKTRRLANF